MTREPRKGIPEVVIPPGYEIEEILDMDDSDFDEPPIMEEEVRLRFERRKEDRTDGA